uniref:Putative ovule protein n=1 Tax=Solanum chacoense TaxID=4108 RepID=A0A0V0H5W4_SOLCH
MTSSSTVGGQSGEPKEALRFVTFWFSSLISGYVSSCFLLCYHCCCCRFFSLLLLFFFAVFMLLLQL